MGVVCPSESVGRVEERRMPVVGCVGDFSCLELLL